MRGRGICLAIVPCVGLIAAGCGGSSINVAGNGDAGATPDATVTPACIPGQSVACVGPGGCSTNQVCNGDGNGYGSCSCGTSSDSGALACTPGESIACVGLGGCSTNQVCNADGSGYGPCDCPPPTDASTTLCVPGQSIACAGAGGCISSQVCNDSGTAYGACACAGDGGATLLCIPGQSIACGGAYGCASFQVCDESGNGYGPCDCPEGGTFNFDDGGVPDGYAPLPPPVGDQGYNAIWVVSGALYPLNAAIFLPLYSAPNCGVVPPYGESYAVAFQPADAGPSGTFPACSQTSTGPTPCYEPEPFVFAGIGNFENVPGGILTLSTFNADGIATGQMNTTEGIVPLVVKNCQ
ncbi:MAG: hypothetical protein ACLQVI_38660 [Polyangiaceae bacterium]